MTSELPIDPLPVGGPPLVGEVIAFDEERGLGTVRAGNRVVGFHCTAITDGSRRIAVGSVVAVRLSAGRRGRVEARWVRPLPGVSKGRGAGEGEASEGGGPSPGPQPGAGPGPLSSASPATRGSPAATPPSWTASAASGSGPPTSSRSPSAGSPSAPSPSSSSSSPRPSS